MSIADEGIGVGLQEPDLAVGSDADVEPRIVAEPERTKGRPADLADARAHGLGEGPREDVADSFARAVVLIPLGRLGGDAFLGAGLPFIEHHLRDRKNFEVVTVPDEADVQLAPVDELLRDCRLAKAVVHPRHPLAQGDRVLHHRGLRDPGGSVGLERLHDEREPRDRAAPTIGSPGR